MQWSRIEVVARSNMDMHRVRAGSGSGVLSSGNPPPIAIPPASKSPMIVARNVRGFIRRFRPFACSMNLICRSLQGKQSPAACQSLSGSAGATLFCSPDSHGLDCYVIGNLLSIAGPLGTHVRSTKFRTGTEAGDRCHTPDAPAPRSDRSATFPRSGKHSGFPSPQRQADS